MTQSRSPASLALADAIKLMNAGHVAAAADAVRRALSLKPADADVLGLAGVIEAKLGRLDQALTFLTRAVELRPRSGPAHFNLAVALQKTGQVPAAVDHYREAIRLQPSMAGYHNNLGVLYRESGDLVLARESFERAVQCHPGHENAVVNLYAVYRLLGAMAEQEKLTQRAVRQWPNNPEHWLNRAEALFFLGRLGDAWPCYQWRFKAKVGAAVTRALPGLREWQGEDLSSKSLLVWTEQGPGDEIMFGTMLREIGARVGRLSVLCSRRMAPLLRRSLPDITVFADAIPTEKLSSLDFQASLLSFAQLLRPSLEAFKSDGNYLVPEASRVENLRRAYRQDRESILIGIAWRSMGVHDAEGKSINLGVWGALFALPNVKFVNLQYGDCSLELQAIKSEYGVDVLHDPSIDPLDDLDAYAAQVAAMDFVICSSNTAVHVAGALGVPAHCMLPSTPGDGRRWYWFARDSRSAWYRSVRLWPQTKRGSWIDVVRDVTLAMADALQERGLGSALPGFLLNLAAAYRKSDHRSEAKAALQALAKISGQESTAHFQLGCNAKDDGRIEEALDHFHAVLAIDPCFAPALNMIGVILASRADYRGAEPMYRRAIAAAPEMAEPLNNLGTAVRRLGRGIEADELYKRADLLMPDHSGILLNLATNLMEIGRADEAIAHFDRLLHLKPEYADAHHSKSLALLSQGRLAKGWPEMWWRHLSLPREQQPLLFLAEDRVPRWSGQDLNGKRVVVWAEHGIGDQILTLSMLADVVAVAGAVTVVCSARLVALCRRSFPSVKFVGVKNEIDPDIFTHIDPADFDYQLSVSELGAAFRPSIASFPSRRSFLAPDCAKRDELRARYRQDHGGPIIGLSWASANPDVGQLKGLELARLVDALTCKTAVELAPALVSLQYGDFEAEITQVRRAKGIEIALDRSVDAGGDLESFAAQVAAMDAVVTISNTAAHVAGALGIPTFLLLPYNRGRHWYWFRSVTHCPWYPSIRYYFQQTDGTWNDALRLGRRDIELLSHERLV